METSPVNSISDTFLQEFVDIESNEYETSPAKPDCRETPTGNVVSRDGSDQDHQSMENLHNHREIQKIDKVVRSRTLVTTSSRSLRPQEAVRIYNTKREGVDKTPSLVFVKDANNESLPISKQNYKLNIVETPNPQTKQPDVVNPAVRNRTGKPMTKAGALADAVMSVPQGDTAYCQLVSGSQTNFYRYSITKPIFANNSKSKDDTNRHSSQAFLQSQTQVDKRASMSNSIENNKTDAQGKYPYGAHHITGSGASLDQDQIPLGGTKTSRSAFSSQQTARRYLPGQESRSDIQRVPRLRQTTRSQQVLQNKVSSSNNLKQTFSAKFKRNLQEIDNPFNEYQTTNQKLDNKFQQTMEQKSKSQTTNQNLITEKQSKKQTSNQNLDNKFRQLTEQKSKSQTTNQNLDKKFRQITGKLNPDTLLGDGKKKNFESYSKRSASFPFLDGFSILNFTENFRFSYFAVPGYVKEHNQQMKRGLLKLPLIDSSFKDNEIMKGGAEGVTEKKPIKRGSKGKGSLQRRIKKLNQMEV
ncbi:uncharacterized protein LOC143446687 isoform X2 [Clavelina lepadiformis]|uniref:uncharacterized protein LOC143446687 isoform X2 n=1 Tax=Clavelina lepadiformis TaxID=159417 RepID=UPI004041B2C6